MNKFQKRKLLQTYFGKMGKYSMSLKQNGKPVVNKKSKKITKSQPTTEASSLSEEKMKTEMRKPSILMGVKSMRRGGTKKVPTTIKEIEVYTKQSDMISLSDKKWANAGFATKAIRSGQDPDPINGGVIPGIDMASTYIQPYPGEHSSGYDYTRCGNPTVMNLQRTLCMIEGGKYSLCCSAGLSAIISVLSLLGPKDHLLCIDDVYGGVQRYLRNVFGPQTEIDFDMIDMQDINFVRKHIKKNTKIIWIEAPTNPTMKYPDIQAIGKLAKEKGCILVIDNTFMSPVLTVSQNNFGLFFNNFYFYCLESTQTWS